jgi:hypothetical protein
MVYRKKRKKGRISKRKSKYKSKGAKAAKTRQSQLRSIKTGRAPGEMKLIKAEEKAREKQDKAHKKRFSKTIDAQFDDLDREYD